jgi:hypothetical protein
MLGRCPQLAWGKIKFKTMLWVAELVRRDGVVARKKPLLRAQ